MKIEGINYGSLKLNIKQIFKNLMYTVFYFTRKNNGILKLKNILNELGIKSEITEEKKFDIIISENPNIFEKELLDVLDYRICSSCGKLTPAPYRHVHGNLYGELFLHNYKPLCKKCFPSILEQWNNKLKDIRDRWFKREASKLEKTETNYIDEKGHKYPL